MDITLRGTVLEASGGANQDYFGSSTALSANGLVLAVGAVGRDNAGVDQGAVYLYDWNAGTSAWVQRGSVMVAADAANYENFGCTVALSSDGAILAVGAYAWELSGTGGVGGVYIFDWSGSAWVQRGSVITPSAPEAGMAFGYAVSLSGTGAQLAVGAPQKNYVSTDQGQAFVFTWTGSAWTEYAIYYDYPDPYDQFGSSVAISSDGLVLAVGANGWDGSYSNDGGVFLYDNGGGYWVPRATFIDVVADDAAANDYFGSAVALNADGSQMLVLSLRYDAGFTKRGRIYDYRWDAGAWTTPDPEIVATVSGESFASIALASAGSVFAIGIPGHHNSSSVQVGGVYIYDVAGVVQTGIASAPTSLTVAYPTGSASAPTALTVSSTGSASASTALAIVDTSQHWPQWGLSCLIDGVDMSSQLVGQASVIAEEDAARIARFSIKPGSGVIAPLDYVGKPVTLDYLVTMGGAVVTRRVFTGRIDTPHFEHATGLLHFDCVDDLQNRVAALDRSVIDSLSGGRYTEAVQGDILDNWDYAKAVMSTVAASLDAGANSDIRVTPWQLTTVWATLTEANLLYQRCTLSFPQRSTIVNSVEATFQYRYPRLRQRYSNTGWSGTLIEMAPNGYTYPTQEDILGAVSGTGWTVTLGIFYPAPASIVHSSGGFIYPADDAIDLAILYLAQRHAQTVTETFTLTVSAPESVTANGVLPFSLRGALQSEFDGGAWESALDVAPLMPTGGDMDYAPDAPRADADYAIETLLAQAQVKILSTHRGARVGNAVLCNPDLDLDKKITISTAMVDASGKVASLAHRFDLDAGSAITEFEIACFGVGGAGIITPDTLDAPTPPAEAAETQDWIADLPALMVNTYGVTPYDEALMGLLLDPPETITVSDVPTVDGLKTISYPNPFYIAGGYPETGFRVEMPGVVDADRNPIEKTVASDYAILVPTDTLTITLP